MSNRNAYYIMTVISVTKANPFQNNINGHETKNQQTTAKDTVCKR